MNRQQAPRSAAAHATAIDAVLVPGEPDVDHAPTPRPGRLLWWGTAAATLLSAALAFVDLGRNPLWHDEAFTAFISTRPTSLLLTILVEREGNMPLYYLLMHGWAQGGTGAGWLRVPSALAAVVTVPVTALIARRVFDDRVAVLAGLVLALSTFALGRAREARTYSLTMLLVASSTLLLLRAVHSGQRRWWAGYGAAVLLAIGAQPLAGTLVLIAHTASLVVLPRALLPRAAAAVVGGLFAVSGALALYIVRAQGSSTDFIEPTTFETLTHAADVLAGSRPLALVFVGLGVVALVGIGQAGLRRSLETWQRVLIVSWLLVPPVVLLLISELRPLWRNRYLVPVAPALVLLMAFAILRLRPRAVQVGVLVGVLALSAVNVRDRIAAPAVEDLPAGARLLLRESRPTDAIVYSGAATRTPFAWVLEQEAGGRPLLRDVAIAPGGLPHEVGDLYATEVAAPALAARLTSCDRVWVVSLPRSTWHPTPEPMQRLQRSTFWRQGFREVQQRDFGGLRIELYERVDGSGRPDRCGSPGTVTPGS